MGHLLQTLSPDRQPIRLADLAFGCYIYGAMNGEFDGGYARLVEQTSGRVNLADEVHRKNLLVWLNKWGCRQFSIAYHDYASNQLHEWHREFGDRFFPHADTLLSLSTADLDTVEEAFKSLASRHCSTKKRKSADVAVTFGPVGTAKILFALRPNALLPWDNAIIRWLRRDESAASYRKFLLKSQEWLGELSKQCEIQGFTLDELPRQIGRAASSPPKLIDEYLWVVATKECKLPTKESFERWAKWS